jgi:purine-binding chemotaxis protein CheW
MNLAEIRKKAQQEKSGRQESLVATGDSHSVETRSAGSATVTETATVPEPEVDILAAPYEFPEGTRTRPLAVETPAPALFDPLAVLLEGRESAGCDEEALFIPTSATETDRHDYQELLCFKVASEEYALNIMDIKEIIKPREVTEVPRVPSFVAGVLSLRGIIIPVFDMRIRLGLAGGRSSGKERIIVVKKGEEGFCGILVDEVIQVVRIDAKDLEPPPTVLEGIDRDFVCGIGRFSGRMLILLNMENILDVNLF